MHEDEITFSEKVRAELVAHFGKDNITEQKYLPETYRFADFYVEGKFMNYAIEVENDFEAVLKGIGQVLIYANELDAVPVIVIPEGHIEEPEATILNRYVEIIEIE
jgi:hypothetical protein